MTAGLPAGAVALVYRLATDDAPASAQRSAVPWNCIVSVVDAGARTGSGDLEIALAHGPRRGAEPEHRPELRVGAHGDQLAAALHPASEHRGLRGGEIDIAQHDHADAGERGGADAAQIGDRELVEPLGAEDLGVVGG